MGDGGGGSFKVQAVKEFESEVPTFHPLQEVSQAITFSFHLQRGAYDAHGLRQ